MRRGKIIGALVLLAAISLILAGQLRKPSPDGPGEPGDALPAADALVAQATNAGVPATAPELPSPAAARVFTIDSRQSEVYWRIYKAGAMARFGHNHVISVGELRGTVTLGADIGMAEWNLAIPVAALIVDDAAIRARYGEDFASVPSENDKQGTKRNMLTAEVLNAEAYSEIRLSGRGVSGSLDAAELPAAIEFLGRVIERRLPARIVVGPDSLTVTGEFRLTHADLGITPFTALGGMMSVGEDIDFSYRIHAVAGAP